MVWKSDRDGVVGKSAFLDLSQLSSGFHKITLRVTDASNQTAEDQRIIDVSSGNINIGNDDVVVIPRAEKSSWFKIEKSTLKDIKEMLPFAIGGIISLLLVFFGFRFLFRKNKSRTKKVKTKHVKSAANSPVDLKKNNKYSSR